MQTKVIEAHNPQLFEDRLNEFLSSIPGEVNLVHFSSDYQKPTMNTEGHFLYSAVVLYSERKEVVHEQPKSGSDEGTGN